MKSLTFLFTWLFVSGLAFSQNPAAQTEVMMKMLSLKTALLKKDSIELSNLLANDVTYGHTTGLMQTKGQLIRSVVSGEQDYKSIEPTEMNIRIYGSTGVVTMRSRVNMLFKGSPLDFSMFVTLVWVKGEKDWKLEARQSVKL